MDTIQLQPKNHVISSPYFGNIKQEVIWSLIFLQKNSMGAFKISGSQKLKFPRFCSWSLLSGVAHPSLPGWLKPLSCLLCCFYSLNENMTFLVFSIRRDKVKNTAIFLFEVDLFGLKP